MLGPEDFSKIALDYHPDIDPSEYVDFTNELAIFAKNPMNPAEKLSIETLLHFEILINDEVTLNGNVKIQRGCGEYTIFEGD